MASRATQDERLVESSTLNWLLFWLSVVFWPSLLSAFCCCERTKQEGCCVVFWELSQLLVTINESSDGKRGAQLWLSAIGYRMKWKRRPSRVHLIEWSAHELLDWRRRRPESIDKRSRQFNPMDEWIGWIGWIDRRMDGWRNWLIVWVAPFFTTLSCCFICLSVCLFICLSVCLSLRVAIGRRRLPTKNNQVFVDLYRWLMTDGRRGQNCQRNGRSMHLVPS